MEQKQVDTFARYMHMAIKLQRTVIVHQKRFPEFQGLYDNLNKLSLDSTQPNPYLHHLEQICRLLQQGGDTQMMQQLHHNFKQDVEALAHERELMASEYYLNPLKD
jgi:hypothetical protein